MDAKTYRISGFSASSNAKQGPTANMPAKAPSFAPNVP